MVFIGKYGFFKIKDYGNEKLLFKIRINKVDSKDDFLVD